MIRKPRFILELKKLVGVLTSEEAEELKRFEEEEKIF